MNDGDRAGGLFGRTQRVRTTDDDDIHWKLDELGRQGRHAIRLPLRESDVHGKILALHIAEITESLLEGVDAVGEARRCGGAIP
jgi:hypothetical protein